jgi:hypothetical protein
VKTTVVSPKKGGGVSIEIPDGAIDDAIASATANSSATVPAFPGLNRDESTTPAFVKVWRIEPPDGYLGQITADGVSEETLKQRFGGYVLEAECVGENGRVMTGGKKREFRLNAPPVPTALQRETALDRNKGGQQLVNSLADVERLIKMQSQSFEERLSLLKEEAKNARDDRAAAQEAELKRLKGETDAYILKAKADAEERERRDESRHTRDLERERERNTASQKQHESFLTSMMAAQGRSTDIVVAALNSSKSDIVPAIVALAPVLGPLLQGLGGGDPSIAIANSVSRSIEGIADIAVGDRRRRGEEPAGERRRLAEGREEKADDGKEAAPKEDKARVLGKVAKLFKAVKDSGNNVEQTLDDAIKFYTSGKGNVPVDEEEEEEETTQGAAAITKKRPRVARSGRVVARAAGKPAVGRRRASNGTPDAPVDTRKPLPVDPAPKRSRASASGAALRATEHQVPARKA